jgi:hypothetical protein
VELAAASISPSGGSIVVNAPGDPFHGLELVVPADAYDETRTFRISRRPQFDVDVPADYVMTGPMLDVENGGGYSRGVMLVTMPITLGADEHPVVFHIETGTELFTPVPVLSWTPTSVTFATAHFSRYQAAKARKIDYDATVETTFRPGVDDWQFPNYGSEIATSGFCSGMSSTAIWYFHNRQPALHGRFDDLPGPSSGAHPTPWRWLDDRNAIRLVSLVQHDEEAAGLHRQISFLDQAYRSVANSNDARIAVATLRDFHNAIRTTGQPQWIGIMSNAGGQHAMIVWRASKGKLWVADPNVPGDANRFIEFTSAGVTPYVSGLRADKPLTFHRIAFIGSTETRQILIDQGTVAQRWSQFENGTLPDGPFTDYEVDVSIDPSSAYDTPSYRSSNTIAGRVWQIDGTDPSNTRTIRLRARPRPEDRPLLSYHVGLTSLISKPDSDEIRIPLDVSAGPHRVGIAVSTHPVDLFGRVQPDTMWRDYVWVDWSFQKHLPTWEVAFEFDFTLYCTLLTYRTFSYTYAFKGIATFDVTGTGAVTGSTVALESVQVKNLVNCPQHDGGFDYTPPVLTQTPSPQNQGSVTGGFVGLGTPSVRAGFTIRGSHIPGMMTHHRIRPETGPTEGGSLWGDGSWQRAFNFPLAVDGATIQGDESGAGFIDSRETWKATLRKR